VGEEFDRRPDVERLLSQKAGRKVVISVKRNEKSLRMLGMARENARLLYADTVGKKKRPGLRS